MKDRRDAHPLWDRNGFAKKRRNGSDHHRLRTSRGRWTQNAQNDCTSPPEGRRRGTQSEAQSASLRRIELVVRICILQTRTFPLGRNKN